MKKILLAVMAVAAIGFTSCGNKTQKADATDSTEVAVQNVDELAQEAIAQLTEGLEANDASKLQQVIDAVKGAVADMDPAVAKEYVAKVQDFLKENADKVKAVVGDNAAVAAAVSALTTVEPESVVSGLMESVAGAATDAKDAAVDAVNEKVEEGKAAVDAKVDEAKDAAAKKAQEAQDAAKQKANDAVDNAANKVKKGLGL